MNADELSDQKRAGMSRLRWERVRRGLTVREVIAAVGISSPSVLAYWETGATLPEPYARYKIARFYGVSVDDLFPHERMQRRAERSAAA